MFLKAGGGTIPILKFPGLANSHVVKLLDFARISPFTELLLPGTFDGQPDMPDVEVLIERLNNVQEKWNVAVAEYVTSTQANLVQLRLANPSDVEIVIPSGSSVARVVPIAGEGNIQYTNAYSILPITENKFADVELSALHDELCLDKLELSEVERQKLFSVISSYRDVISLHPYDIGQTELVEHSIETGDSLPIRQHPRRLSEPQKQKVNELIEDMCDKEIIQPSQSPWASPIVLVRKKDGDVRFCIDYRKLNDCTKKSSYPLPRIDESLDQLSGCRYFSTLDLRSGYWQIKMKPSDKPKTAFTCYKGLYEFNVMPFGLCNAPSTFQHLMRVVLNGVEWNGAIAYLDDIIVYGRTFNEHTERLENVFSRLRQAGLKLGPSKCKLLKEKVKFLGHVVSHEGISCDPQKVEDVSNWPTPKTLKEVRQFLGLSSYYRKFIPSYSQIASPLNNLVHSTKKFFLWTEECKKAFGLLKELLTKSPVLRYPDLSKPFIVDTDACNTAVGCVLSQLVNGEEHPVSYSSRSLTKTERNYSTTRKELLAVIHALKVFRCYLTEEFLLRTDHASLRWLWESRDTYGQCARWFDFLCNFNFKLIHRAGRKHTNADSLSRRPCSDDTIRAEQLDPLFPFQTDSSYESSISAKEYQVCLMDFSEASGWSTENTIKAQQKDPVLKRLFQWMNQESRPSFKKVKNDSKALRHYWNIFSEIFLHNGMLYRRIENSVEEIYAQLLVPSTMKNDVLKSVHDLIHGGGHMGVKRTFARLKERFFWPFCHKDVETYCKECCLCDLRKVPRRIVRAPLVPSEENTPMQKVEIDVLSGLPETRNGNRYILVVCDTYTKYMQCWPMKFQNAKDTAYLLYHRWVTIHGVPETIHSDQGRNFESILFQELSRLMGCNKTRTSPYHAMGNGGVERNNQTIIAILKNYVQVDPTSWDDALSSVSAILTMQVFTRKLEFLLITYSPEGI
ncbi:unnamed protein product [Clavelina lepadiformis]|uniref:Gypsy retrotransposon integrase-like protein 1 n=1 Tax=Clavelina lepadiformis TaxID=159417 RepID=A0ABP0GR43_CLALP